MPGSFCKLKDKTHLCTCHVLKLRKAGSSANKYFLIFFIILNCQIKANCSRLRFFLKRKRIKVIYHLQRNIIILR
jgi:hypothetical protein